MVRSQKRGALSEDGARNKGRISFLLFVLPCAVYAFRLEPRSERSELLQPTTDYGQLTGMIKKRVGRRWGDKKSRKNYERKNKLC